MPWDVPGPWVTGNLVTAAEMNARSAIRSSRSSRSHRCIRARRRPKHRRQATR
jgi:hypothetical protein